MPQDISYQAPANDPKPSPSSTNFGGQAQVTDGAQHSIRELVKAGHVSPHIAAQYGIK